MFGGFGATELLIVLALALVIFGGGKIAGVGRSLGTAIQEFKSAVREPEKDETETQSSATPQGENTEQPGTQA